MFNLPNKIAPAWLNLAATVQSCWGMKVSKIREPEVVRIPAVLYRSLRATGMPCSGPRDFPACMSASALLAAAKASSGSSVMKDLSTGSVSW